MKSTKTLEIFLVVFVGVIILSGIFIPIIKNSEETFSDNISSTPVSEWGFKNLEDMDNKMIRAVDYSIEGDEKYIIVSSSHFSGFLFENGYRLSISGEIDKETGEIDIGGMSSGGVDYSYEIVNNDNLDLNNGWTEMIIRDRIVSDDEESIIFNAYLGTSSTGYLVPYTMIDFSKNAEEIYYEATNSFGYKTVAQKGYKIFLK